MLNIFGYADAASMASHWTGLAGFTMLMLGAARAGLSSTVRSRMHNGASATLPRQRRVWRGTLSGQS